MSATDLRDDTICLRRFFKKVEVVAGACWEWRGAKDEGYGRFFTRDGKINFAHRISYATHIGPIPDGMLVCHHCDNRACVNPEHLFLGTPRDNMIDMVNKGRNRPARLFGSANPHSKMTLDRAQEARQLHTTGTTIREIARLMGVGETCIGKIIRGERWALLEGGQP